MTYEEFCITFLSLRLLTIYCPAKELGDSTHSHVTPCHRDRLHSDLGPMFYIILLTRVLHTRNIL